MTVTRIIFALAAAFGALALIPGLLNEAGFIADNPPALTHPEFYYGFHGVALVFQLVFVLIAFDPARYRPLILVAVLEKLAFFLPTLLLFQAGRVEQGPVFLGAMIDGIFMLMFIAAWFLSRPKPQPE